MARWLGAILVAASLSGGVQAAAISADLRVSVTVLDQCVIHSLSRSASCSSGAPYAVGVAREAVRLAERDQLTAGDEPVQTSADGARIYTTSQGFGTTGSRHDAAPASTDSPQFQQQLGAGQLVRVTYSF
jgi:hypothetical protein